jgi:hypothetical protein
MKLHRRQLILTSFVLALGAAVYLNWHFSEDKGLNSTDILETQKELGEARYVNTAKTHETEEQSEPIVNISKATKEYFAKAKMERQKSRDEATQLIKNSLSGTDVDEKAKADALTRSQEIAKSIQQESNIENLIKAKGFGECMAFIQNGECSIIVNPGSLNESSVITIRDIISGQSGIPFEKIKITEAK